MKRNNWTYKYGPPLGDYNYNYYFTHPHEYIGCLIRKLKWFYQRGTRGYADSDVWSLDWHLTGYMGRALRDLAQQVHGTPIIDAGRVLTDYEDTLTLEEWRATIIYIAETFDIGQKINNMDYLEMEEYNCAKRRFDHGMAMFVEYFFALCD